VLHCPEFGGEARLKAHFTIGDWQVEPELNTLSRENSTIHLEPKVMQVLVQLALHAGEVLSKEQLIEAVWPDTFVSEQALTRCISVLRRELQDNTHTPRYIQTISKSGYRLVATVHMPHGEELKRHTTVEEAGDELPHAPSPATEKNMPPSARRQPWPRWGMVAGAALLLLTAGAGIGFWHSHREPAPPPFRTLPLTSYAGQQDQAAFSPNGNSIAFVWTDAESGNRNIFVKQIGSETTLRLTHADELNFSPVWSPDGTQVAYLSAGKDGLGIYQISSLGGPARRVHTPLAMIHWDQGALSWAPDGRTLIFPDGETSRAPSRIYRETLDTQQSWPITNPPPTWDGDFDPVFSPDGKKIAFIRASDNSVRDIYVMPANGGQPRQITHDGRIVDSMCWLPGSDAILFSSNRGGKFALWKVSSRGGEPERLPVGTEDAFQPVVHGSTHRLLFTQSSAIWSILRVPLRSAREGSKATPVVSSTEQDSAPSFAPDGTRFAFQSWRSGTQELWIASRDGNSLRQLTYDSKGLTGSPAFSPDSQQVAFDSRTGGYSHIFAVSAAGGSPRQLTFGNSNNILPHWSVNGRFVYFSSNRSGAWQIWKLPAQGGQPQQITTSGGFVAAESPDGQWLYVTKAEAPGVWRIPAAGGAETKILNQPPSGYWGYLCVGPQGIYFLDTLSATPHIALYEFATGKTVSVVSLDHLPPIFSGLSVDSKEDELLLTDKRSVGSHITLVENFR